MPSIRRLCLAAVLASAAPWSVAADSAASASQERSPEMAASSTSKPGTGSHRGTRARFDANELAGLFAESLGGWKLVTLAAPVPSPMPTPHPAMEAEYERGADHAQLSISDDLPHPSMAGTRSFHEQPATGGAGRVVTVGLANGLVITASSRTADGATLRALVESMPLDRAEAMKPTARR
jgi:hypothetical protein